MTRTDRLFFALWPEPDIAQSIYHASAALVPEHRGRRILPEQLHLTLAFLGSIETERLACVKNVADKLTGNTFRLSFDTPGFFPKPQVVWLGMQEIPPALQVLQAHLTLGLQQTCELQLDTRPYVPHLTLWRKVKQVDLPSGISPVMWPVRRFVLAASRTYAEGAHYQILQEWPLKSPQD